MEIYVIKVGVPMNKLENLITASDFRNVTRAELDLVATDFDIVTENKTAGGVVKELWDKPSDAKHEAFARLKEQIFAGSTSVSWYKFLNPRRDLLLDQVSREISVPTLEQITSKPHFMGCAELEPDVLIFRFAVRTGIQSRMIGLEYRDVPQIAMINVVISLDDEFIEVRSEPRIGRRILEHMRADGFFAEEAVITRVEYFTEDNATQLASNLGGRLVETLCLPTRLDEMGDTEITKEEGIKILEIIKVVEEYVSCKDDKILLDRLSEINLDTVDLSRVPLSSILVAGMNKIVVGTQDEDLTEYAFYNLIDPGVTHREGLFKFPVVENGIEQTYTIRVGFTTKTIFFYSNATETVIRKVRENILGLTQEKDELAG